jgi:CheY-like chemotaxis protein
MNPPGARILCTEDDPDNRDLIVMVLNQSGFDVACAKDADNAIRLAKTERFDLYNIG